jgi:hypothetical protein
VRNIEGLWQALVSIQETAFDRLAGLFPSTRWHPWGYRREDNSAYFTATLYQNLARLIPDLTPSEQIILEQIREKACLGLAPFRNKQGLERYNFWKTNPSGHFPNGRFLNARENLRPPDDVDDSVMIYLLQNRSEPDARWLKDHIDSYANGSRKWVMNVPSAYKNLRAYCTFFSRDMPLGFDACVITNVLYFNRFYGFETNFKEVDSVEYLIQMFRRKDHVRKPYRVSPYYPETTTILYHLARLMSQFPIPALQEREWQVVSDLEETLAKPLGLIERQMTENAWMWMTNTLPPPPGPVLEKKPFVYFVLPLTLEYPGIMANWLAQKRFSHIRFSCPALEIAIELENQILRRKLS